MEIDLTNTEARKDDDDSVIRVPRWWWEHTIRCLDGELPKGRIGDAVFLLRDIMRDMAKGIVTMSALQDQFKRAAKVKPANSPGTKIGVWEEGGEFRASISVLGGDTGGKGKTPEEAIHAATTALVSGRK